MLRPAICCLALMLPAACVDTPPTADAAPSGCTVQKVADIPIVAERGFITAPASVEGKPVTMLIDTGSEATSVTPEAVAALRLARDPHAFTTTIGTGGRVTSRNARLQSFAIGGLEVLDQSDAVAPLPSLSLLGFEASGVLGARWLSDYDIDLDVPHRRMALYSVQSCTGDYLPWTEARTAVPARLFGRGLVLLQVALNGAPETALLDSGSAQSAVTEAAAVGAGVSPAAIGRDPAERALGADGNPVFVRRHVFDTLQVDEVATDAIPLALGPLHVAGGAQMLLGLDWLRQHRVWIAYGAGRVFIAR